MFAIIDIHSPNSPSELGLSYILRMLEVHLGEKCLSSPTINSVCAMMYPFISPVSVYLSLLRELPLIFTLINGRAQYIVWLLNVLINASYIR